MSEGEKGENKTGAKYSLYTVSSDCFLLHVAFKMIEGSQAPLQKLVYMFGNIVCLALAVYKCQTMGLLPTYGSDWLAFVEPQKVCLKWK